MTSAVYTDLLRDSLIKNGGLPCFNIKRNGSYLSYTYADFHRTLNSLVDALRQNGFAPGESGIVIGENGPEWVIAYHAFFLAGGRTVPVDPNLPVEEIREIVRLTRATFIMCSRPFSPLFSELTKELPFIKKTISLEDEANAAGTGFGQFLASGSPESDAFSRPFSPTDHIITIFTSGTTGKAKGVMLSQRNLTAAPVSGAPRMKVTSADTMLAVLPLHHVFGAAACIAAALCSGVNLVFVPSVKGPLILEAMRDKHVTILPAVPQMIGLFYDSIERGVEAKGFPTVCVFSLLKFLSSTLGAVLGRNFRRRLFSTVHGTFGGKLNLIVSGGASIEKKYLYGFHRMGFDIVEGYGLTETFGPITIYPTAPLRHGSVGFVLADNEMKIDAPNDRGIGEVLFRGATVFNGYFNNEDQTKAVFDADGWFHTGDLGRVDSHGYLYLSGRKKDVIVLPSGKNAYPDEIEEFYSQSGLIDEIGVFGVAADGGEIIAALIVPAPIIRNSLKLSEGSEMIKNEIDRLGRTLPSYKKLSDFAVVYDPLPRTSTKKLKKHELRQIYRALRDASGTIRAPRQSISAMDAAMCAAPDYALLTRQIASLIGSDRRMRILPSHLLELDLGLDSLKRLELLCRLEEAFSIVLPEEILTRVQTAGDLYSAVMSLRSASFRSPVSAQTDPGIRQRISRNAATADTVLSAAPGRRLVSESLPRLAFWLSRLIWRPAIIGREHIEAAGASVFFANHESFIDILWILYALPRSVRDNTFIIGKNNYLRSPLLLPFVTKAFIAAGNGADVIQTLSLSLAVLKKGHNLIIFPEGTRTRTGRMGPFKAGIGMLVKETDAPIVPVKISGTYAIWPAGRIPKFFGAGKNRPSIAFGKPLSVRELIDKGKLSPESSVEQIAECLRTVLAEM